MKSLFPCLLVLSIASFTAADDLGELIFQDDFNRNESQEKTDEPGNGWGTNSKGRAQGDKQVDLKDGTMRIFLSPRADHAVSVTQPAEFTDGAVGLRFMLEDERDSIGLNFADLQLKEVWAGHLFVARVSPKQVELMDLKTGNMRLDIRMARTEKKELTEEQKQAIAGKSKKFSHDISVGQWHDLLVKVSGDELTLSIDGKEVRSFQSPGMAHPTKRLLRLAIPRNAVVDDVRIWRKK